jgi:hypothetical protein
MCTVLRKSNKSLKREGGKSSLLRKVTRTRIAWKNEEEEKRAVRFNKLEEEQLWGSLVDALSSLRFRASEQEDAGLDTGRHGRSGEISGEPHVSG